MATHRRGRPPKVAGAPPPVPDAPTGDPPAPPGYSYQQKYTRCNKPTCRRCAEGPGHGPYWYAFWWEGGRTHSRYLGKTLPPVTDQAPAAGELPPKAGSERDRTTVATTTAAPNSVPAMRVVTLGRFALWRDGVETPDTAWVRRRALSLFKLLLSAPDHRLQREQVLDLLWPDEDPQAATVALRGATHAVRRVLGGAADDSLLATRSGAMTLSVGPALLVDADAFVDAARPALASSDIAACRAALALYTGEYLPDDLYEDWTVRRREELSALRLSLLLHQARLCGEHGDLAEARDSLAAILAIDPAHEEAASRQMTLLAAMGERSEALRVYSRLRDALREHYDAEPGEEVAGLAKRLRAQLAARTTHRPLPDQPPRLGNLPAAQSTFVGRRDAQDLLRALLGERRLVTLTGAGGSGKTRLAVQVATSVQPDYPDGVWLCELAGLAPASAGAAASPNPVAGAVAGALGVHEEPGCSLVETLGAFLEPRRLLLVLDNCEHLLDPAAHLVAALLARCPDLSVLATSQEALSIGGEAVWTVPPLALPDPADRTTPELIESYDAIRLFVERARARRPGFALDAATAPPVLEICRKLDGIPLALELAAARLAFLSLEDLAARLDDRFRLLVGGSRVALPRQQTLRATMDWSYNLLGAHERTLLQRLTTFAGGCTLTAAEGVCAGGDLPREIILDTLGGLVAKSLVAVQGEGESLRYGMLETVRQYGQERLAESGEEQALHERHLAWFATHCEAAIAAWSSADQATLLRRLDADLEDIRAALNWGLAGDVVTALRLTAALGNYWYTRGLGSEGRRWTERALAAAPQAPLDLRATGLNRCAILARMEGDLKGASSCWEASLALFRELEDVSGIARVVGNLGLLRYDLGDDAGAVDALIESLTLQRREHNPLGIARNLLNLGMVYTRQQRYAEAEATFAEATGIWQDAGDQAGISLAYLHTAHLARDQEQLERAEQLYVSSLRVSLALDDRHQLPPALEGIAHVLLRRCDPNGPERWQLELSTQLFACAAALRESAGVPLPAASQRVYMPDLRQLQAILGPETFESAWCIGWEMPVLSLVERLSA